ncbi:hypothetical protein SARC_09146 [Sphaeroforma arctica JP610]|uniref:RUN domain-containing protein n=1 Tax=Sphaeroforma arctica JP610 TaxID=667725 RepID=A0A0L0FNM2_9EUKA|nr:hypothetical protein SARC_09146 [Sphaeroforma arctica JP610]KNC78422.1 hypothetical protein SARC_09146 [Sphaeroforma arctica JP610]|eukprot:XP_014152324.1 hypothetical protein SARC_09146 [Sphaeroforma arctica JP610]
MDNAHLCAANVAVKQALIKRLQGVLRRILENARQQQAAGGATAAEVPALTPRDVLDLCDCVQHILSHGMKKPLVKDIAKLFKRKTMPNDTCAEEIEDFWPVVEAVSSAHPNYAQFLARVVSLASDKSERGLMWIKQSVSQRVLATHVMFVAKKGPLSHLPRYYHPWALMRDAPAVEAVLSSIAQLERPLGVHIAADNTQSAPHSGVSAVADPKTSANGVTVCNDVNGLVDEVVSSDEPSDVLSSTPHSDMALPRGSIGGLVERDVVVMFDMTPADTQALVTRCASPSIANSHQVSKQHQDSPSDRKWIGSQDPFINVTTVHPDQSQAATCSRPIDVASQTGVSSGAECSKKTLPLEQTDISDAMVDSHMSGNGMHTAAVADVSCRERDRECSARDGLSPPMDRDWFNGSDCLVDELSHHGGLLGGDANNHSPTFAHVPTGFTDAESNKKLEAVLGTDLLDPSPNHQPIGASRKFKGKRRGGRVIKELQNGTVDDTHSADGSRRRVQNNRSEKTKGKKSVPPTAAGSVPTSRDTTPLDTPPTNPHQPPNPSYESATTPLDKHAQTHPTFATATADTYTQHAPTPQAVFIVLRDGAVTPPSPDAPPGPLGAVADAAPDVPPSLALDDEGIELQQTSAVSTPSIPSSMPSIPSSTPSVPAVVLRSPSSASNDPLQRSNANLNSSSVVDTLLEEHNGEHCDVATMDDDGTISDKMSMGDNNTFAETGTVSDIGCVVNATPATVAECFGVQAQLLHSTMHTPANQLKPKSVSNSGTPVVSDSECQLSIDIPQGIDGNAGEAMMKPSTEFPSASSYSWSGAEIISELHNDSVDGHGDNVTDANGSYPNQSPSVYTVETQKTNMSPSFDTVVNGSADDPDCPVAVARESTVEIHTSSVKNVQKMAKTIRTEPPPALISAENDSLESADYFPTEVEENDKPTEVEANDNSTEVEENDNSTAVEANHTSTEGERDSAAHQSSTDNAMCADDHMSSSLDVHNMRKAQVLFAGGEMSCIGSEVQKGAIHQAAYNSSSTSRQHLTTTGDRPAIETRSSTEHTTNTSESIEIPIKTTATSAVINTDPSPTQATSAPVETLTSAFMEATIHTPERHAFTPTPAQMQQHALATLSPPPQPKRPRTASDLQQMHAETNTLRTVCSDTDYEVKVNDHAMSKFRTRWNRHPPMLSPPHVQSQTLKTTSHTNSAADGNTADGSTGNSTSDCAHHSDREDLDAEILYHQTADSNSAARVEATAQPFVSLGPSLGDVGMEAGVGDFPVDAATVDGSAVGVVGLDEVIQSLRATAQNSTNGTSMQNARIRKWGTPPAGDTTHTTPHTTDAAEHARRLSQLYGRQSDTVAPESAESVDGVGVENELAMAMQDLLTADMPIRKPYEIIHTDGELVGDVYGDREVNCHCEASEDVCICCAVEDSATSSPASVHSLVTATDTTISDAHVTLGPPMDCTHGISTAESAVQDTQVSVVAPSRTTVNHSVQSFVDEIGASHMIDTDVHEIVVGSCLSPEVLSLQRSPNSALSSGGTTSPMNNSNDRISPMRQAVMSSEPLVHKRPSRWRTPPDYVCTGCLRMRVTFKYGFRFCNHDGRFHCRGCHTNHAVIIPGRVVREWDFTPRPVCDRCRALITSARSDPIYNLRTINSDLYQRVPELVTVEVLRVKLGHLVQYLRLCRLGEPFMGRLQNTYLADNPMICSMNDLYDISSGEMTLYLWNLVSIFRQHVITCEFCSARGHVCDTCRSGDTIFPFDTHNTHQCEQCGSLHHIKCYIQGSDCVRCIRLGQQT